MSLNMIWYASNTSTTYCACSKYNGSWV